MTLVLDGVRRAELERFAASDAEREACGLLVGTRDADGSARVAEVTSGRNLERDRPEVRFVLDPLHLLEVERRAEARGQAVLGVWHTHLAAPAIPSETDRRAAWAGWSHVIVALSREGAARCRAWRLVDGSFQEEPLLEAPR